MVLMSFLMKCKIEFEELSCEDANKRKILKLVLQDLFKTGD